MPLASAGDMIASMPNTLKITVESKPRPEDQKVVNDGLMGYNSALFGDSNYESFAVFLRTADGGVVGGLSARLWWHWLYVEKLWIAEAYRGKSYGRHLLQAAEAHALAHDCRNAALDSIDPGAVAFYQHLGWSVWGVLEGFPPGQRQFFLRKSLG